VDINAKLLESGSSLAPGSFRSVERFARRVSLDDFTKILRSWPDCFIACSDCPAWKRLISDTLATYERISLITVIFSDRNQVKRVRNLSGDDAQAFVDKIDEVILMRSHVQKRC